MTNGGVPADGLLFQEQDRPEIYLIRDGARLHIPNAYVMEALSLDSNAVQTVPQGALDHVPRDPSWEPLGGSTPGSTVFTPFNVGALWNAGKVYWPLKLATTKRHYAWGQEVRTIELRGWIGPPGGANAVDPDYAYHLDVDVGWLLGRGIDLTALLKVGNILQLGEPDPGITDPRAWCATPLIKLEISGFPPKGQRERKRPPDWTFELPGVVLTDENAGAAFNQPVQWPFDPVPRRPDNNPIEGDEYVRVFGSVVTDKAHVPTENPPLADAVKRWQTGLGNNENDDARWTEIHPPDWIVVPSNPPARSQLLRGVAVVAPGTYQWRARIETVLDVDIQAPPKPGADAVLRYREFVGPETVADTIIEGNASKTGAAITTLANPDGIRLHVKVGGTRSFLGGSDGKFRALYWLYWAAPGAEPEPLGPPVGPGPHRVTCVSKRRVGRLTAIAAIGGLNADGSRWELAREQAITVIEAGTRFYVQLEGDIRRADVVVARRFTRRYLKTRGDSLRGNNLLQLPTC